MADTNLPPLGLNDLLGLLGGANPLGAITKSVQQFQRGVNDLLTAIEQFNATMEQLNLVAARVNRLLDDVEPATRALLPQITRTIETTEAMVGQLGSLAVLPRDVGEVVDLLRDLARRLQPLGQMAESAGGLFGLVTRAGGLRTTPSAPKPPAAATASTKAVAPKAAGTKRASTKSTGTPHAGAKSSSARKVTKTTTGSKSAAPTRARSASPRSSRSSTA